MLILGTTGFGFILSKQGRALVYPIPEYVRWGKTIFDLGHEGHDSAVRAVGEKMITGESGVIDHGHAGTGLSSWIFYSPILTTGWSMGVVYIKPELPLSPTTIRRERMQIVMGLMAFLLLLSALIFRVDRGRITHLWRVAFSISCVFVAGIGGMWYLEITVPDPDSENVWLEKVPDLYFNIIVARNILNPFISKIVPMTVVACMLFSMIMIASNERERHWLLNFNSLGIMTSCAALFFVIIFSQIDLREKIASNNIVYLEYFSFVMYLAILAVIVNAIVFAKGNHFSFIQYQDNLIPKLLYWPVILASLLGITLFIFYFY